MRRRAAGLLLIAGLCASPGIAETVPALPPYAGAYQPQGVDEIGLWQDDDESERELAASSLVIHDEKLTAYVKQVLCDTVGEDRCQAVRVYIIRDPTFNASMSPNGTMRVLSGLFLRLRNEAELGAILGHEFGHFESRHSLTGYRANRSNTDVLAWASVLASFSLSYEIRRSYENLELSVYGAFYRFGRDQEREADRLGIAYLNRSLFQPQAAALVWENLMAEAAASARAKGLKKPNFSKIAFTASHPPLAERAAYLTLLAAPEGAQRGDGAARYRAALASWMPLLIDDQIKLNDFGGSDYLLQSIAATGWTAELWSARGELYRTRGNPRDLVNAADFYAKAVALDPAMAEAHRGLGLALLKSGRPSQAYKALRAYLDLKPGAPDAGMIRTMLSNEGSAP